ncbi:MAG: DUF6686 family protein [Bacteroidota bacterium]
MCRHCSRVGLYYKNLLVGFEHRDFQAFSRSLLHLDFDRASILFPNGSKHLVVDTCHEDIQFTFLKEEYEELKDLLNQALLMLEVNKYTSTSP